MSARGRAGAAADHGGHAGDQRLFRLLRTDPVNMGIDPAGGDDFSFGGNHFRRGADGDGDVGLDVGVAGFADGEDPAVLHADIGLNDAPVIDDQRVGEHQVNTVGGQHLSLAHPVADHFAAAEFDLFPVGGQIVLHLDPQLGVGQAHLIADGGAEHVGIGLA